MHYISQKAKQAPEFHSKEIALELPHAQQEKCISTFHVALCYCLYFSFILKLLSYSVKDTLF